MLISAGKDAHALRRGIVFGFKQKLALAGLLTLSILAVCSTTAQADAPVAAYSFDEGSGETVEDSAGDHDGTIEGASWASVGKYGSALEFDGENDLVSIADAADLDLTASFTLEAWVRPESTANWRAVLSKGEVIEESNAGYLLLARGEGGKARGYAAGTTVKAVTAPTELPIETWSHLAFTSDGTTMRLYIDGTEVASSEATAAKATAADLEIGHWPSLNTYFNGLIDEVRIYDEALSESAIQVDRDNRVQAPPATEVTTSVLDTGPSAELVSSVPITTSGNTQTVIYSLPVTSLDAGEVLRVTGGLEVTNKHAYDVTDSVQVILGDSEEDTSGLVITPWASAQHTKNMLHWTFPFNGVYRATTSSGSTQYVNLVLKASSPSAEAGDTLIVQPNFGRMTATRYTPAVGPMAQPTHKLQVLDGSMPEQISQIPVDSVWRRVLTRRVDDVSAEDILDITGQLEVQNTSGTTVKLESMVKMTTGPFTTGSTASPITLDQLTPDVTHARLVETNQFTVSDPSKNYMNLLVRAVPVGSSPEPLTISAGSGMLNVMRFEPSAGDPSAPLREGTRQVYHADFYPDVESIPFAVAGGSEKRVVASAPLWGGLEKGEVLRARGLVTGDLNGGEVSQVLTQLILGDSPTATTGDIVATLSGDKVPATTQIHTSIKEGVYVMPAAEPVHKYLNYVVYASQANPSDSMSVPAASVSFTRSQPSAPLDEGFEDGIDSVFHYDYNGTFAASSEIAREGSQSLLVDMDLSKDYPGDGDIRRNEVRPPNERTAGGYEGEETWHGFSVYFPKEFDAPSPAPAAHFDGLIDEVRLYDEALSEEQISADRDGNYSEEVEPVAAYSFEDGEGSVATDSAGGHDGNVDGATWTANGRYGSALSFDGINDIVDVADSPDLDFTDTFTLEAWVRPDTLTSLVPVMRKSNFVTGYGLLSAYTQEGVKKPTGFSGNGESLAIAAGEAALATEVWSHLALAADGSNLRIYVDGQLVDSGSMVDASPTEADLTIGGPSLAPAPKLGTWNIFTQLHHINDGLNCTTSLGPPIDFNVRHYKAGAYTNPGESETATPVEGDYIEVGFNGGQIAADCQSAVKPTKTYVLAPLEHERWYDFVLHTRWTYEEGTAEKSNAEVWLDGKQVLGDETTPIVTPNLYWHETPAEHNTGSYLQFGLYRGPSLEDPKVKLYIDAVRRGESYIEVAPGQ